MVIKIISRYFKATKGKKKLSLDLQHISKLSGKQFVNIYNNFEESKLILVALLFTLKNSNNEKLKQEIRERLEI